MHTQYSDEMMGLDLILQRSQWMITLLLIFSNRVVSFFLREDKSEQIPHEVNFHSRDGYNPNDEKE